MARATGNTTSLKALGIATGFLIAAIHHAGLVCLELPPNPMRFLPELGGRGAKEKAAMILPVGYPVDRATVPADARRKPPLEQILTVFR